MSRKPLPDHDSDPDTDPGQPGLYDPLPEAAAEPWFLAPADPDDPADSPALAAVPRPTRTAAQDWQAAQAALAVPLAQVARLAGRFEERLTPGAAARLALTEASAISWWAGDRVAVDRLALWLADRVPARPEEARPLARAAWAARRLTEGAPPAAGGWASGLADFLDRRDPGPDPVPDDDILPATPASADLAVRMEGLRALHPLVQGAALLRLWSRAGAGPATRIEAATLAARHAAQPALQSGAHPAAAPFLPLAAGGAGALRAGGPDTATYLAAFLAGQETALQAALAHLADLARWEARARHRLADLSGRTPGLLVPLLLRWPLVSAPLAQSATGASRAAVQRNLVLFTERGLTREVTGQGRYRLWSIRL